MTQETKNNLKQVALIVGGLIIACIVFGYLFSVNHLLGWIVFTPSLIVALFFAFGVNPFAKKAVDEVPDSTVKARAYLDNLPDTTKSITLTVTGVNRIPSTGLIVDPETTNQA